jgi:hypothetical protein
VVVLVEVVVFPPMVEVVLLLVMEACSWEPVVEQTGLGFDFVVDSTIGTSVVDVYCVLHNIVLVDPGGLLPFAASLDTFYNFVWQYINDNGVSDFFFIISPWSHKQLNTNRGGI